MTDLRLPRSAPENQGIASRAILKFVERVERDIHGLHSFILVRHGQVVAEGWWAPYAPDLPHMLFSLSKSFTSSAVGLAVAESRLSVDDRVLSFFPDEAPAKVSKHLAEMRVRDLLTMTTGHAKDATRGSTAQKEGNWVKGFLALPVRYKPGKHFVYNSAATYLLSAIIQKLTGMTLLDYLTPRLFAPLGITDPTWETCPKGINVGGWGLKIRTEDIACFGQMYLQKGAWQGRQILPADWIAQATTRQVSNDDQPNIDWSQGYGFQFWLCRHNIYRGDGAFGQFCIVMPDQDAVLAITSGVGDMQAVLNVVWQELLPAMGVKALPADAKAQGLLSKRLSSLALRPPDGDFKSPLAAKVSQKVYQFKKNGLGIKDICLDFGSERCRVEVSTARGRISMDCGTNEWLRGEGAILERGVQATLARGVWTAADTYLVTVHLIETPFCMTMTCRFEDGKIFVANAFNVSFGPTRSTELEGKLVSSKG